MAGLNRNTRRRTEGFLFFIIISLCLILSSCSASWPILDRIPIPHVGKNQKGVVFESEEYVVYVIQGEENSETLAERFLGDRKKSWVIEDANEGVPFVKNQRVIIPLKIDNKGGLTAKGYQVVPILNYHHFLEDCDSPLCVPPAVFDQHMKYLKDNGYRTVTMEDLQGFLQYRKALPKRSLMITIDDGYRSAYDIAYPILKRYGFTATFFIYTDYIGVSGKAITWGQLKEMNADGFQIGSHTLSHSDLTMKKEGESEKDYLTRIEKELMGSKQIIDMNLTQDTMAIAFPFGRYDENILSLTEQAGYELGFSVEGGGNPFFSDALCLRRTQILKKDLDSLITKLDTFYEFPLE
ncbi:MAG: polysaccharide deacetylase family protein [Deltaproteobacteria bacterium]|nr:polysaccharide deacetylase family protein [Deltaproteobacteria bacterium]